MSKTGVGCLESFTMPVKLGARGVVKAMDGDAALIYFGMNPGNHIFRIFISDEIFDFTFEASELFVGELKVVLEAMPFPLQACVELAHASNLQIL
ncbi:MAG TPA: hypothetical protein VJS44_05195 [Pyrinomonadaceae bacterium]|nr:hypothetical protein [Pyrinomonadaceae bacterium]